MSYTERRIDCKVCGKKLKDNQLIYCSDDHREQDYMLKQKKRYDDRASIPAENKLQCQICGKWYKHLGSHIAHGHKMLAREYKEEFGLPYNMALVSEEITQKKRDAFWENSEQYLKNLKKAEKKYYFKKGHTGQRRISQHERETILERILNVNEKRKGKMEQCPVCKMQFNHLDSHLVNKHKLLRVKGGAK